ncbi:Uncharacterised protein [Shewanella algae]|uniref:Uncharacterized protein n=1 Tax=Shewanella algae TaxID=38313 RepID=A0A380BMP7_9GAMM|nr:Uncharacterised protein [Shewanella algae]
MFSQWKNQSFRGPTLLLIVESILFLLFFLMASCGLII